MTARIPYTPAVALVGLDGANPLGFLAALGVLVVLEQAGESEVRLRWKRGFGWSAVLEGLSVESPRRLGELLAQFLVGASIPADAAERSEAANAELQEAKKQLNAKRKAVKARKLKSAPRRQALESEVAPLQGTYDAARRRWLDALAAAAPRPELALGSRIDCNEDEFRQHAVSILQDADARHRDACDLLAAFATDACPTDNVEKVKPTPFQFISGSGHQFFLTTIRDLIEKGTPERIEATLFHPWTYPDDGLSLRWDPVEDRRYALMDRDPTASGNKPRTQWMANLLAYRGLALFTVAPRRRGPDTVGWTEFDNEPVFTWPIWAYPASADVIRSLLVLEDLRSPRPNPAALRARGIAATYRSRRIKVGTGANYKVNFSPARQV